MTEAAIIPDGSRVYVTSPEYRGAGKVIGDPRSLRGGKLAYLITPLPPLGCDGPPEHKIVWAMGGTVATCWFTSDQVTADE